MKLSSRFSSSPLPPPPPDILPNQFKDKENNVGAASGQHSNAHIMHLFYDFTTFKWDLTALNTFLKSKICCRWLEQVVVMCKGADRRNEHTNADSDEYEENRITV